MFRLIRKRKLDELEDEVKCAIKREKVAAEYIRKFWELHQTIDKLKKELEETKKKVRQQEEADLFFTSAKNAWKLIMKGG